jgi:3-mercaptopyruvate sulfurtransferase SseA
MASPEEFSLVAGKLSIGNGGTIIVYDIPNQHMGVVAWALRNGRARGDPSPRSRQIIPRRFSMRNQSMQFIARSAMPRRHARPQTVFWDTRSLAEFHGAAEGHGKPPPRSGHIEGAVHLDWLELIDPNTKTFKPAPELRALLESKGITPEREVNTYCGGGRRGSIGTLVLKLLGYDNARSCG